MMTGIRNSNNNTNTNKKILYQQNDLITTTTNKNKINRANSLNTNTQTSNNNYVSNNNNQNINTNSNINNKPVSSSSSSSSNNKLLNSEISQNDIEIVKLKIYEEEQLKEALEQSYNELLEASQELEKRMNLLDEESNEWKTRFENQEEINRFFNLQIELLDYKINELRDKLKNIRTRKPEEKFENNVSNLEKEKQTIINQLRDYEWRIEQENKAYHIVNEERKELHQEITDTRNSINAIKERQDLANYQTQTISMAIAASNNSNNVNVKNNDQGRETSSRMSVTDYYYSNIPMDKRVLDPRKGPINKNAAVRLLPKLDANN